MTSHPDFIRYRRYAFDAGNDSQRRQQRRRIAILGVFRKIFRQKVLYLLDLRIAVLNTPTPIWNAAARAWR